MKTICFIHFIKLRKRCSCVFAFWTTIEQRWNFQPRQQRRTQVAADKRGTMMPRSGFLFVYCVFASAGASRTVVSANLKVDREGHVVAKRIKVLDSTGYSGAPFLTKTSGECFLIMYDFNDFRGCPQESCGTHYNNFVLCFQRQEAMVSRALAAHPHSNFKLDESSRSKATAR